MLEDELYAIRVPRFFAEAFASSPYGPIGAVEVDQSGTPLRIKLSTVNTDFPDDLRITPLPTTMSSSAPTLLFSEPHWPDQTDTVRTQKSGRRHHRDPIIDCFAIRPEQSLESVAKTLNISQTDPEFKRIIKEFCDAVPAAPGEARARPFLQLKAKHRARLETPFKLVELKPQQNRSFMQFMAKQSTRISPDSVLRPGANSTTSMSNASSVLQQQFQPSTTSNQPATKRARLDTEQPARPATRENVSGPALKRLIMALFEKQPYWTASDIKRNVPASEVLLLVIVTTQPSYFCLAAESDS